MIGVSGIRGRMDGTFTPSLIAAFGHAFGHYMNGGRIIIGRDTRPTGETCRLALLSGLLYNGCHVMDLGICPTPTVLFMVTEMNGAGGVAITASHNPIEWNALKFVGRDGLFLDAGAMKELIERVHVIQKGGGSGLKQGLIERYGEGVRRHIDAILGLSILDVEKVRRRRFRVALDCCNGAGSAMTPMLLKRLGCEVVPLFCGLEGGFPRGPEPLARNLEKLADLVRDSGVDLGMAHDPDADRLSLVDESGKPLGEESTLALAIQFTLGKHKGPVVTNESTSMMIDDIARTFDVEVHRTRVGEVNVARRLMEVGGVIGGEGNGGVILPELHYTRDAPMAAALILQYLAESGDTLGALASQLPKYVIIKGRVELRGRQDLDLDIIRDMHPEASIGGLDGLKMSWEGEWVHIRKSGTEPIVRIIVEAENSERAGRLYHEFEGVILGMR